MRFRPALPVLLLLLAACATTSTKDRETAVVHADLGLEAVNGGRGQDALASYDEALRHDPNLAEAHLGRGIVLEFFYGKDAEAEAEYRKAIQLKPQLAEAHNDLGQLLARTGRLEEAVAEFDAATAIMLYREPWVARCNKAQALWRMGKKDEGVAEFKACLNFQPRYCQGWREFGRVQLLDGQTRDAVASFEQYTKVCDRSVDAWQLLGSALVRSGQVERAREAFSRCADLGAGTPAGDDCRKSGELIR